MRDGTLEAQSSVPLRNHTLNTYSDGRKLKKDSDYDSSVTKFVHEFCVELGYASHDSRNLVFLRQYGAPEVPCSRNLQTITIEK